MRMLARAVRIAVVIAAVVCLTTCDSYNIVEPRFYSDSDIVEISTCPADKSDPPDPIDPTEFSADVCWTDKTDRDMRIDVQLPRESDLKVTIVGSAGNAVATVADGSFSAGLIRITYDASPLEDGVYAVSAVAGDWQDAIWFEIE